MRKRAEFVNSSCTFKGKMFHGKVKISYSICLGKIFEVAETEDFICIDKIFSDEYTGSVYTEN